MKLPLSQLKLFLDLSLSPNDLAETLTLLGLEVEGVYTSPFFEKVIVAEILSSSLHPKTNHLLLLKVTDGTNTFSVVCSDLSCQKGDRVAYAKEGATLPTKEGSFSVKKQTIQGFLSEGMLVSAKEMALSENHEAVYRLDKTLSLGEPLFENVSDTVFDISLTPNLGHCLSVFGIARELAAFLSLPLKKPSFSVKTLPEEKGLSLHIREEDSSYFSLRKLENVHIEPSPFWLKRTLELFGIQSINNVVDVTNYMLMLYGQPLHLYDASTLHKEIGLEELDLCDFSALDGKSYSLKKALCVTSNKTPICLAGVLGGEKTAVSSNTKALFLEAASFSPSKVRKTGKQLPIKTESGVRAEKGGDIQLIPSVVEIATSLLEKVAKAKAISETKIVYPKKPLILTSSLSYFQKRLGVSFSLSEVKDIFQRLFFSVKESKEKLLFEVPLFRHDVTIEADLLDELARIYGLNRFSFSPSPFKVGTEGDNPAYLFEKKVRKTLIGQSLQEIITPDLVSPSLARLSIEKSLEEQELIQVKHAKSEEYSFLRPSLLGSHLSVLKHNFSHKVRSFQGFEIAHTYSKKGGKFQEHEVLSSIFTGEIFPFHFSETDNFLSFLEVKGILENLFSSLHIEGYTWKPSDHPSFHPERQANIYIEETYVGALGEIHPSLLAQFDLDQRAYFFELSFSSLYKAKQDSFSMKELPLFPGSQRDWTLTVDKAMSVEELFSFCKTISSSFLEKVELRAIYESEKLGKERKNLTFRFYYRDLFRTLSFEEIEKEHQFLTEKITNHLKGYLHL